MWQLQSSDSSSIKIALNGSIDLKVTPPEEVGSPCISSNTNLVVLPTPAPPPPPPAPAHFSPVAHSHHASPSPSSSPTADSLQGTIVWYHLMWGRRRGGVARKWAVCVTPFRPTYRIAFWSFAPMACAAQPPSKLCWWSRCRPASLFTSPLLFLDADFIRAIGRNRRMTRHLQLRRFAPTRRAAQLSYKSRMRNASYLPYTWLPGRNRLPSLESSRICVL